MRLHVISFENIPTTCDSEIEIQFLCGSFSQGCLVKNLYTLLLEERRSKLTSLWWKLGENTITSHAYRNTLFFVGSVFNSELTYQLSSDNTGTTDENGLSLLYFLLEFEKASFTV